MPPDICDIDGVAPPAQQMIGVIQRHEALGMLGGLEDQAGILDSDRLVARCMKNQQRLAELFQLVGVVVGCDVIEK
jgi:hypothetical protein